MANNFTAGHALIIGTGTDNDGQITKDYKSTINDANWLATVLKQPSLCAYPKHQVKVLVGGDATRENIIEELDALKTRVFNSDEKCSVVVFFSGHGKRDVSKTYLIPSNYRANDPLATRAIDGDLLYDKLRAIEGRVLLLLNACYAGGVMPKLGGDGEVNLGPGQNATPLSDKQLSRLLDGKGFAYLSAAQSSQKANTGFFVKNANKTYSPFTIGLSRGFSGKGKEDSNGEVRCSDIIAACVGYVTSHTKMQQPCFDYKGENFVVGHYTAGAASEFPLLGDELPFEVDIESAEEDEIHHRYTPAPTYNNTITVQHVSGPALVGHVQIGNNPNFSYTNSVNRWRG